MKTLNIEFNKCIQDSQEYGSDNEHMVSRLFFTIEGEKHECNIRQPYGENFSFEKDPIEVETPEALKKRINYEEFREAAEQYFRKLVGSNASGIRISGNSSGIRMKNNTFIQSWKTQIHESGFSGGW